MAADTAKNQATYQDVLDAPEHMVAEVLNGELHTHPRPAGPHAEAASVLGMDIGGPFHRGRGGPGGWIILYEPELHLGIDILVPDLGGWRRERLPAVPDAPYFELAPDWACEVLSPATALVDRRRKLPIYAREQVRHLWLVDPRAKSVEVFRLDADTYRLVAVHGDCDVVRIEPFEAVELSLSALWPERAGA
ncbi:MAG: Uma2 family endonuclease [Myxococcales bacterium]|nr:Uma2 family endonuclease [Myxococcales bacterium]